MVRTSKLENLRCPDDFGNSTLSGSGFIAKGSVGGGHKGRALAHGYSIFTPSGFKTWCSTPGVQPEIWVTISPQGGEGRDSRECRAKM